MATVIYTINGLMVGNILFTEEEALEIHTKVAELGWCNDTECPCYQHGAEAEREQSHES